MTKGAPKRMRKVGVVSSERSQKPALPEETGWWARGRLKDFCIYLSQADFAILEWNKKLRL
jgi:hypothetical protein